MSEGSLFRGVRLCVVGNINRDVKTAPFPGGSHLLADGETSIPGVLETIGGGGAISASAAVSLGAGCDFIGQTGDDALGRHLEAVMTRAGVKCWFHRARGLATGTTLNLVYNDGQRHFLSCHPNNEQLAFETLNLSAIAGADHLYRADPWFSEPMLFGGNRRLLQAARDARVPTSMDINWDPAIGRVPQEALVRRRDALRSVLGLVDFVHGNERELCAFTGAQGADAAAARLLADGAGAVVLHLGEQGAGYASRTESVRVPSVPVVRKVNATGTGDLMSVCGMLLGRQAGMSWREKLEIANEIVAEYIEGRRAVVPTLEVRESLE
jgi:ribokinase